MSNKNLEARLDELETRVTFQDDLINTLNDQIAAQEQDIRELWEAKRQLKKDLNDVAPSWVRKESEEEPPPHY